MGACLPQLPQRLLLFGAAILAVSAVETADLVHLCGQTWQGPGLLLRSHSTSRKFYFVAPDTDCGLWVRAAAPGDRIRFQFRFFLVYSLAPASPAPPAPNASALVPSDPCVPGSYLQFYEGPPGAAQPLGAPLCGLTIPAPVASSGPFLGLRLVTRGRQPRVDFVGEVTSFRLGPCGAYFRCRNGRCIPPGLVCDRWGMDNCGDGSDQGSWPPANCRGPSLVPGQTGSVDGDTSASPPFSRAPGSAGSPQATATAQRSPPEGRGRAPQDTALEGLSGLFLPAGPWRWGVVLASSLLLACAGLLVGLLRCCCSSGRLAWWPAAPACTVCHVCPGRVTPGGLQLSGPVSPGRGDHP
ncbi:low-density lipoprotein receptor class A domain-containing protein 2 [Lepus europaeus]|uniref:low-density lipoprotein receptor class A domain-containing protein 2 n=1 Tax=Lepus europaeus TaxID=9983 RepID=UPI002B45C5D6|nr:low-density lipoprotein receptor class A domain-containing protein 2 [Lepus europaeus]